MLKLTIDYWKLKELAAKNPADYELLRGISKNNNLLPVEDALAGKGFFEFCGFVNDVNTLPEWVLSLGTFEPVRSLKFVKNNGDSFRGEDLATAMVTQQVHLPGNELLKLSKVEVREDYCTESLQDDLNDGWRIVAVIPRAGQRRPDYVLGKVGE